ncbi:hypothetical protein EDD18DRAFT_1089668 [Armillaria luteobubalina]|uniref:Solute carrier family 40 protein n=1 Tax=Armillaria luteobubalina TaxID=153913 RepID=A0AA39P157_9AGAR|nr:hypothetical protein EDD18DRAFT_1089668 [Armillaria luteobubalina]
MIVFLSIFTASIIGAQSSPDDPDGVPVCAGDQRTVLSIIWSCLGTIFACTWVAVHPNVLGHDITTNGIISCAIEWLKIWSMMILAPDVIVAWAAEQFIVAWKLCHGEPKLTLSHCFLLSMGGFSETALFLGTLVTLKTLESEPDFVQRLTEISQETIEDRNKRDTISKALSILQSSWFISQCVARIIQHLPITLLKMMALAFAGISMVMYSLWWYKPLNMKYHIPLDSAHNNNLIPETSGSHNSAPPVKPWLKFLRFMAWMWYTLMGKPPP